MGALMRAIDERDQAWRRNAALNSDLKRLSAALNEAMALIETAEHDGYVSEGWREDARSWRVCWADAIGVESAQTERP